MPSDFAGLNVVLWGARGHALVLSKVIHDLGGRVVALVDNDPDVIPVIPQRPLLLGKIGLQAFLAECEPACLANLAGLVAIGGNRGADRRVIGSIFTEAGVDLPVLVHPRSFVYDYEDGRIGAGSQVLAMATLSAGVTVGEACIVNHGATVDHECYLGDGTHVAPGATLCGLVETGKDVFVGAGATVLPRISIGESSIIGAGAVVTKDVPAFSVVVGNPGCVVRKVPPYS